MKSMIYKSKKEKDTLADGKYRGIQYYIVSLGTHPCAYIQIPFIYSPPYFNEELIKTIDRACHGGITYHEDYLNLGNEVLKGDFIGWDYAHTGDYFGYYENFSETSILNKKKKWTTKEILKNIKEVINAYMKAKRILEGKR